MAEKKMDQQVIFYSNTKCDQELLAETLYNTATNYPKVKIEIDDADFFKKFNLGTIDDFFQEEYE